MRVLCALAVIVSSVRAADPKPVRVMSWNIRYDNPRDGKNAWKHRRDWVADIIKREKPDLLGMQEVLARQLKHLTMRLPDLSAYAVGRDDGKTRGESVPILYRKSRFQLLQKGTFWLSKTPDKPGSKDWDAAITRIASWLKLKDKSTGKVLYAINTHFDHRGRIARAKSAELLVAKFKAKFVGHPVVLTGDFNTLPNSTPHKTLTGTAEKPVFRDAYLVSAKKSEGPNSTWCGFRAVVPNRRIDFVFVRGCKVQTHRILTDKKDGRFPSDHLPVCATITPR